MKKTVALLLLLAYCLSFSAEQILIGKGESPFVIVHTGERSRYNADFLQKMLFYATGTSLKVLHEKEYKEGTPAVFIGPVQKAKTEKLIPSTYARWEHRIDIRKNAVFLTGSDSPGTSVERAGFESGTLKAVITFLERFANCCFFAPAPLQEYVVKQSQITLPDTFSYRKKPAIEYCMSRSKQLEYDLATNALYSGSFYNSFGGHSYPQAVPMAKYLKTNPEYFILRKGKRNPTRFNHLCISNKNVQALIYQNLLDQADKGYQMVQLGQTDAFQCCHCGSCRNLYGLIPKGKPGDGVYEKDPAWKEKLWIMHREMAERFKKDRPGKQVAIMAYGPTQVPPAAFKKFPDNVWIELAPFTPEIARTWRSHQVKAFSAYLYLWGTYNAEGFTPNQSFKALKARCEEYRKYNIRGLYRCGFGELPGLAGPAYYIWGKLLDDPEADTDEMLKQYCRFAFPKNAKEMEDFYKALDSRLDLQLHNLPAADWNSLSLLTGKDRSWKPLELFQLRYPEKVLFQLEELLKKAEKKASSPRLKLLRVEFDYLCHTARAVRAMRSFRKNTTDANWEKALNALEAREKFIKSLPVAGNGLVRLNGEYLFGRTNIPTLMMGGRLSATLFAPFNWGASKLRKYNIKMSGRQIKVDAPEWQYLVPHHRWVDVPEKLRSTTVRFRCQTAPGGIKFIFVLANARPEVRNQYYARVFLGPEAEKLQWFPGRFKNGTPSWYKLVLTNEKNNGKGNKYAAQKGQPGKTVSPAPGIQTAPGEISMEMFLPYSNFERPPRKGEAWLLNISAGIRDCDLIWEFNMEQTLYSHTTIANGKIIF